MTYFVLLIATLCIELAMNLPVGSVPLLLDGEHVSRDLISLAMGAGMAAVVIISLPVGALVDRIGRLTTMKIALFFSLLALLGLNVSHGPLQDGLLMGLRSVSLVCFMTAQAAYVSVLVPPERSVSAVATMGIMGNIAFALGPACAVWLWQRGLAREQFLWATIVVAIGFIIVSFLPSLHDIKPAKSDKPRKFLRKEWLPAMIFSVAGSLQGGVNGALAVLVFHDRGIVNGALLFSASACTTVVCRYFASRAVERFGPRGMSIPTAISQGLACLLAAIAYTTPMVIAAGICFGVAWSFIVPVVLGLYFEESEPEERGAAMGAFNFAFGSGAAAGALIATATTTFGHGYDQAITICALAPVLALPLVLRSKPSPGVVTPRLAAAD